MREVIVVESGAKTKTIRRFLRGTYDVIACGGHIMDLSDDGLGIDVDNNFAYQEQSIKQNGKDKVARVREQLSDADCVYLGTDPDREGEAIAADIENHCVPQGADVHRIEFNAIVYHAVKEALDNPRDVNENRVEAQRARRAIDRLIGFIISSMAQFDPHGPRCPSVGRVLAPAVSLVVDREAEIRDFKPRHYWTIHSRLTHGDRELEAILDGEWEEFEEAKNNVVMLQECGEMQVVECEEDPNDEMNPRPPYTTDALQDEADYLLNFTPDRTMKLAQDLYQGIEIDGQSQALITYMRTDSTRLSPTALNLAKKALAERDDTDESLYRGRQWRPSGAAQDAHEAIRPTKPNEPDFFPDNLEGKVEEPYLELYRLIYYRFLASQMQPAVYHTTHLTLKAEGLTARAEGHRMKSPGFLKIFRKIHPDYGYDEVELPHFEMGPHQEKSVTLSLERAWPEPQKTRAPARYREGSLVRELKSRGIGRPSTYGDILNKIKNRFRYVRKTRGKLRPTEKGEKLCDYLHRAYDQVISYEYTAHMEEDLEKIEGGEESYEEYLQREFEWLREPYEYARKHDWLSGKRPTPAQVEYLRELASRTDTEVPESVYEARKEVSQWIDKLQDAQVPFVRLTHIRKVDVSGVECHRFRLQFNKPLPDEEKDYLKECKMKYKPGKKGRLPALQFQRQNRDVVQSLWDELYERYSADDSPLDAELRLPGERA
ncbi:MAG: type I DNA topoisomerase [Planctomycetota bacterium]